MSNAKIYTVLGIMTGTSMDGIDLSLVKTDGKNYISIISEKSYQYSLIIQKKLKNIVEKKPNEINKIIKYFNKFEKQINQIIIKKINKFFTEFDIKKNKVELIGLSGQTVYHNPQKKITIQLGSAEKISNFFKIKVISNFREKDINNGGEGAPIGAYYHRYLINTINRKAVIVNIGGVSNFTQIKNRNLFSSDIGPGNAIIDDLSIYFYNKKFDKDGLFAKKGNLNKKILNKFKKDIFFRKKLPKSLDRNYFKLYINLLKKIKKNDAINTALYFTIFSIENIFKIKSNKYINELILTGGGRKNKFLLKILKNLLNNIKVNTIDKYNYDGDLIESQMFGYIAVRSLKKLIISTPKTTNNYKAISGGELTIPKKT